MFLDKLNMDAVEFCSVRNLGQRIFRHPSLQILTTLFQRHFRRYVMEQDRSSVRRAVTTNHRQHLKVDRDLMAGPF